MRKREKGVLILLMLFMGSFFMLSTLVRTGNAVTFEIEPILLDVCSSGNPSPGTPFQPGNGSNFQVQAGNRYQIRTQSGFRLNMSVDTNVEMNVTEYECYPEGPSDGNKTMNRFMKIEMNQTADVNATMGWEISDEELNGLNRTTLKFAFHNGTRNAWQHVTQNWQEGNMVYCNTTHFSTWTITGELQQGGNPSPSTPFQAGNGTQFQVQAGERYQIQTQSGFKLNMSSDATAGMTVTECDNNPAGQITQNRKQLGNFWNLSLEGTGGVQATLEWAFKEGDIQGLNRETLKFAYYDENANTWKNGETNWIEGNTVYCNTTHFSIWTIIGDVETQSTPGFTWLIGFVALVAVIIPIRKLKWR
ncbi:MAG: hypothetical protein ACXAEU_17465 [Candidatus Hodarchaeales archaeon]|jgi:hypothetical protein